MKEVKAQWEPTTLGETLRGAPHFFHAHFFFQTHMTLLQCFQRFLFLFFLVDPQAFVAKVAAASRCYRRWMSGSMFLTSCFMGVRMSKKSGKDAAVSASPKVHGGQRFHILSAPGCGAG